MGDIREKLAQYDVLLKLIPGGVGIYEFSDGEIKSVYVNDGIIELLSGYSDEERMKIHQDIDRLILKEDFEELKKTVRQAILEGCIVDCSVRYYKTAETIGWLWVRGVGIEETKNHHMFFALLLDITKQKEMEMELLLQQERYRILEETCSEILFELDPHKDIMTYSIKGIDGTISRKEVVRYLEDFDKAPLVHPDFREEFKAHLARAVCEVCQGGFEYLSKISGHGYEWHKITYFSIADENGKIKRILGRTKNIHDEVIERRMKQQQGNIDQVSNLYTKSFLVEKIRQFLKASPFDCKHTLVLVGINHFHKIVEKNGHSCGDNVVQCVSKVFQKAMKQVATFGRQGNEKFMAYLENDEDTVIDEKIQNFLDDFEKEEYQVADIQVCCSVGVASIVGDIDFEELYDRANEALHLAKITKGTNYVRVS